jgi:serine phosphatase RsbU (regulator of sigma subunit)/tetratricopeptide (TPR) repeat protein
MPSNTKRTALPRHDKSTNCYFGFDSIRYAGLTLLIVLLSFADQSFAQNSRTDSLKAVLSTIKEDTSRVKLLIELGDNYRYLEIDSSSAYTHKAIKLAEQIDAKGFLADALIDAGINHQIKGIYDSAIHFFQKSLEVATEMGDRKRIEIYYAQSASLYHDMGLYDSAVANYSKCLNMAKERGSESGQAWLYNCLGVVCYEQGLFDEAVRYYLQALEIREKQGDKWQMTVGYNNIGIIYRYQDMFDKALEYFKKALAIHEELQPYKDPEHWSSLASVYNSIGEIYNSLDSVDLAKDYFVQALQIFEELGLKRSMAKSMQLLGDIYLKKGDYSLARGYYSSALELNQESGDKMGLANSYVELGNLELRIAGSYAQTDARRIGHYEDAVQMASRSYTLAREMDILPIINDAAHILMIASDRLGDHENGMKWAMIYIDTQDSMYQEDKIRAIQDMNTKYETEKKQQQIELQESQLIARDATIKQQKTFRNALIAGLFAIILIILVVIYAYVQRRRDNNRISDRNAQITEAYEELATLNEAISKQNTQILESNEELTVLNEAINKQKNEILDSINYAKKIQSAMLPPEQYFHEFLAEVFILFKPRDIVSGDFYWIKQVKQYTILAAADCTGHGVPGAFMSMLGMSYLNEIVHRREITQANQVLNELRKQVRNSLRQYGETEEAKDGIDMALCVVDEKNKKLEYSGANIPLYLIRDKNGTPELTEVKADRMPLGYYQGKFKSFTNHDIQLEFGDVIYLFSDGFIDQKGGKQGKKFLSKNFRELLLEIHDEPLRDQKTILDKTITEWIGEHSQIDDILVMGFRV